MFVEWDDTGLRLAYFNCSVWLISRIGQPIQAQRATSWAVGKPQARSAKRQFR